MCCVQVYFVSWQQKKTLTSKKNYSPPPTFLTKTHNFFRSTIRLNSRIEEERTCLFLNGTKVFQKSQMARRCDFISVSSPFWEHMQCIAMSSKLRKKCSFRNQISFDLGKMNWSNTLRLHKQRLQNLLKQFQFDEKA